MKIRKLLILVAVFILPIAAFSQNNIDLLILNQKYDQALTEIDQQLSKEPSTALYLKKGVVYQSLQNYQEALAAFTLGLQIDAESVELLSHAAESFSILGNNVDAINFYDKATSLAPEDLSMAAKLGRVHINLKDYKTAFTVFSGIYENDSTNVYWNKQLAYCSFRTFQREKASYLYEKVLEANPRDYGSYTNLIHTYNWKKHGNEIMATIEKGLEQFPNDAGLFLERAMYLYKTKRYGPAMINFEKYLAVDKEPLFETTMNYAISTYFAEYEEKALEIFKDLMNQNPNDPLVMYYQSLCYKKMKDYPKAEEMMQWAIDATTPDYVSEMYHHLGQIFGQQRKFKESITALEKSYELNANKQEVLFEIATTYEEYNSNKTLALNYYRIYLKEVGEKGKNITYALDRIDKLKEDLFFEE